MTEHVEFLENFINIHTSSIIRTEPLQAKVMLSVGGVLISQRQTCTILRFHLWAPTWTTNTKGRNASSFRVPDRIRGLWQNLEPNETEVCLDFHIYAILDFDLLIGYPLKNFSKKIFPWEPWWKVGNNCFRHSYPLSQKSKGEAATQLWPIRGGEMHIPIRFT
jgi:hypothetical protein